MSRNTTSCARRGRGARGLWVRVIPAALGIAIVCGAVRAAAAGDEGAAVRLSVVDVSGKAVSVPEAGRPTVLLFLLAGQPQGRQAVAALEGTVGKAADARVVTIVGGSEAAAAARQLVADRHPWPIVVDADHALSGRLSVHAYPTTVIVSPDGARVGHVAGQPKAYASNVEAYLDLAAGRIDRAALERRLANHEAVLDSPEQMAERHVQVAARLLQKGLVEQSRAELARAVALRPKDDAVRASLADLLLKAGDVAGAASVLEQMDAGGASGTRGKVLRARLLIATEKWDEARALLASAVQLNPDPAEALYLLGLVYQRDGDSARAADAFRRAFEHTPAGRALAPASAPGGK